MGNSPLTVCISQAWEKQTVQVVLPVGQVMFMPHPVTVAMLMEAHPSHVVCQGSPSLLERRLPIDKKLESGEIYYLLPSPQPVVTTTPTRPFVQKNNNYYNSSIAQQHPQPQYSNSFVQRQLSPQQQLQKVAPYNSPPPALFSDKSTTTSDYTRLNLKPQKCLINLFVFRHSVASVMPEESFKPVSQSPGTLIQHSSTKPRAPPPTVATAPPPLLNHNPRYPSQFEYSPTPSPPHHSAPQKQQPRGVRGRKQVLPWRPHLESISETRPVLHTVAAATPFIAAIDSKNVNNNFSVSMISSISKALGSSPRPSPPSSPLHHLAVSRNSYGGQQFGSGFIHGPLSRDRDTHRQRFIYSA